MIIALIAMGIVLVYRSSRVINFAVGDLGVPATGPAGHHGRASTTGPTGWRSSPPWPSGRCRAPSSSWP